MFHSLIVPTRKSELRRERRTRRSVNAIATIAAFAIAVGTGSVLAPSAMAATGDQSAATGQFLSGSLFDLPLGTVVDLAGVEAHSDGTSTEAHRDPLDLTALGLVNITLPSGVQIPLDIADVGVISEYAEAVADGSSLGASGLVSNSGAIGVGPNSGDVPGDLTLSLGGVVGGLGLDSALLDELANLDLRVGAVSGLAQQAAPAAATGSYEIADLGLTFQSPTLAGLTGAINAEVSDIQTLVDGLESTLTGNLDTVLGVLGALLSVNVNLVEPDLAAAVAGLTTGTLSDPAYPGVTIDLSTGAVAVDLDEITALNGLAPGTDILTDAVINEITAQITGLVGILTDRVEDALMVAINGIAVTGGATLAGFSVLTIDTTVEELLAGDTSGLALLGAGLALPGGLTAVLGAFTGSLTDLSTAVTDLGPAVLAPVTTLVVPAVKPVLNEVLTLTVNNQSTSAGVFTETALRVTVLPTADALVANLGTGTVGPNSIAPVVGSLSPDNGPETGGTVVTITGTGFTGVTGVTFDGVAGTSVTVVSDTEIEVTSPVHVPGAVDVVVQHPSGDSAPGEFTFTPVTTIDGLDPEFGPEAGGTVVTITGHCFTDATDVLFGASSATSFTVVSDTEITATAPAGTGVVDVTVLGSAACGDDVLDDAFTYISASAPVIGSLTPDNGPETGGTVVSITGTGFTGATGVTFDGVAGTSVTVVSDTEIEVTSPAHAPGPVDVVILHGDGNSAPGEFTFTPVPMIGSLTPDNGPETGGTVVTITGTGFTGATGVTFDGVAGTSATVVSDTEIEVTSPAHAPGPVDVVILHPNENSAPGEFTFTPVPMIGSLTPDNGPETGGTVVTITGTGFTGATGVTFDGVAGTSVTVVSDTEIEVTSPAHAPGPVDVVILHPNENSAPGEFTFTPVTTIDDLDPDFGPEAGGTEVTITGHCFTGATDVLFGASSATSFTVVSDTEITATAPAGTGEVAVSVIGSASCGTGTIPDAFTYLPAGVPAIGSLTPDNGPETGGTVVTITGTGFTGVTGVTFDGVAGTSVTVVSDTEIEVTSPVHVPGAVDVVVQHPSGDSAPGEFTFTPVTTIDGLDPEFGPEAGGTVVTITGHCFTDATDVLFGASSATSFTVVSDTEITATAPAGTGVVDVTVLGSAACGDDVLDDAFTYISASAPVIGSLTPDNGPETGGTVVSITGSGFTGATGVTFDGVAGTSVTVVSDTEIEVTSPVHAPGPVDVVILHGDGNSAPGEFTFTPVTTIDTIGPDEGPEAGGTEVTITGHCFTGATDVLFGTTSATSFTVISDTEITAIAPAGTGVVDVTVLGSAACGDDVVGGGYSYNSGGLAYTGAEPGMLVAFGVLLLLIGAALVQRRRGLAAN